MSDLNTGETVLKAPSDDSTDGKNKRTAGTVVKSDAGTVLNGGEADSTSSADSAQKPQEGTSIDGYKVNGVISESGREAVVYLVMKNGVQYALKLYSRAFEFMETKMEMLKSVRCPYVAHLEDYGYYGKMPYEIYPYYKNGTIEKIGRVEGVRLKEYIFQLNEALNCLHNADKITEMIHGDLKPSNIFLSDDGTHLIIGDFGISSVKGVGDDIFGQVCGTPEFAPPSTGVVGTMNKTRAYDYGSLGLVVLFLATGYSYFAGYSAEQISVGWKRGIEIPEDLESSVKRLLGGLLTFDEGQRFTYERVKDWYDGSFVQVSERKEIYAKDKVDKTATLWMGVVDNQIIEVSSIQEWVRCMKDNWALAAARLGDRNIDRFVDIFYPDGKKGDEIRAFADATDKDAALFKIIYALSDVADFVYKGKKYHDISNFIKAVYEGDKTATEAVEKGLLMYYVVRMGYSEDVIALLEEIMNLKNCPDEFKTKIISYSFSKTREYNGWTTVEQLREAVCSMELDEIEALTGNTDFLAWLYVMGVKETALFIIRNGG